ncbi:uncharacterized protein E0L32_010885 [Thyridium curvatum]|uniref:HMA domain-containing protein n=1 Tax=Thyridium curvatum TaxID=1093900 RepID=A0A507AF55_9PEZI|nr:uncharacterized protein E0L32_010885 [Thyridium curvatum]TPX07182.1 hypothetical protein E0L32_010885 [Thyridium curvatum]
MKGDSRPRASAPLSRTTLLVPSIHCPTCTSFIEALLTCLDPKIRSVETSIVNHSVTVAHEPDFDINKAADALIENGYGVDSIFPEDDPSRDEFPSDEAPDLADDTFPLPWLGRALHTWSRRSRAELDEETTRRRHAEHCKPCREALQEAASGDKLKPSTSKASSEQEQSALVVTTGKSDVPKLRRAVLSVDGMSCSSCVSKITGTLEEISWVKSASVALLTRSANVEFYEVGDPQKLVDAIDDIGYEAAIEEVGDVEEPAKAQKKGDRCQASFTISGMSCSSCVGKITHSLESLPWISDVNVNLVTHNATVVFEGRDRVEDIIAAIKEDGYDATLNNIEDLGQEQEKTTKRTVAVRIDGMYCQHCPSKVTAALQQFGDRVSVGKSPTLERPIMSFTYQPDAPDFTVRAILAEISGADPAFSPAIYHPPTVEERSRQMLARSRRRLFYRVLLAVAAAIPSLIIGIVYMNLLSSDNPGKHYLMEPLKGVSRAEWSLLVIATPVYFFCADVFHRRTIKELYALWRPGSSVPILRRFYRFGSMDMLVSFATSVAYWASIAEIIVATTMPEGDHMKGMTHLDSVVFLTMFLLIGRLIEAYSKAKTGEAVTKLGSLRPKSAMLVTPARSKDETEQTETVSIDMIDTGDLVRVVHGGSPPWDGILTHGEAEFVESSLTGESKPVKKAVGDPIYAGTVNKGGPITMRITGASGDSLLDQIIKVVREGQARRAPIERVADKITGYFVPVVTLLAIATWLIWLGLGVSGRLPQDYLTVSVGGWPYWSLQFAIAVFVIACPCGIGLAAPTALFVGGGLAAQHGILAKGGGEAFQEASHIDIIVFDKTGTLTEGGEPKLTDHRFFLSKASQIDKATALGCVKELEGNSSHPIAKAVVAFCDSRHLSGTKFKPKKIQEIAGKGMKGLFEVSSQSGTLEVIVGNEALMKDHGVVVEQSALDELDTWKDQAKSVVLTAVKRQAEGEDADWSLVAIFATADPLRPESQPVINTLHKRGVAVWMISGDNAKTANAVAAMVGIKPERVIAGVLPEQKAEQVKYLQKSQTVTEGRFMGVGPKRTRRPIVAMVGDGVNDSPALTVADVGIAIGSGSDVAISAAEFVLVNSSLQTILTLTSLSRAVFRRVKFNFAWALVYNVVALPIAAGVIYPIKSNGGHTRLDPAWAALAMALSSLSVICSSLVLRSRLPLVGYRG